MAEAQARSLSDLLRQARSRLEAGGVEEAAIEARLLVGHFCKVSLTDLVLQGDLDPGDAAPSALEEALVRRLNGEPVHRIIGYRDFHGVRLALSPATLEPRADTEALVELALELLAGRAEPEGGWRLLDLGTGSGAIALALLKELLRARAVGSDVAAEAVATARRNAEANSVADRFEAIESDWFGKITGSYDVILSNPPYIRRDAIKTLSQEVREHDPLLALDGGPDGLGAYRRIAAGSVNFLRPGGFLVLEIGYDQQHAVAGIMGKAGFHQLAERRDLNGIIRAQAYGPA